MITIVHGGQSGVDRGAHEAAIDNGWCVVGYMPRDGRDELGKIPEAVARCLTPHDKTNYAARTEANVQMANAALIIVHDADDPRVTPGTTKTIELATARKLRRLIVDPSHAAEHLACWIWRDLMMMTKTLMLPFGGAALEAIPTLLLVAGPRESKWPGACVETAGLLRRVGLALAEIARPAPSRDRAQPLR